MAARSLGTLTLDLIAKIGGFERGMDAAERKSRRTAQQMEKHAKKLGVAVGTMLAGGVTALAAFTVQTANSAREIQNLSKVANTNSQDFQRMTFAASRYGVEQEKVADILKDVNDKVGDFLQTGGGPLKDFFENVAPLVGVTANEFKNLSGDQALQLYVDSLEAANLSQSDMVFYMEAIASDATKLLPLLSKSGKELKTLGDEAERTGNVFSDMDFEELAELDRTILDFKSSITGMKNEIVLAAVPAINDMMETLNDPSVKEGIKDLANSFISLTGTIVELSSKVGTFFAALDFYFDRDYDLENAVDVSDLLLEAQKELEKYQTQQAKPLNIIDWSEEIEEAEKAVAFLEGKLKEIQDKQEEPYKQRSLLNALGGSGMTESIQGFGSNDGPLASGTDLFGDGGNFIADTAEAVNQYKKEQEAARKEAERLSAEISNQVAEWEKQAKTLGFSSDALAVYNLEQMGATDAQIASVEAAQEQIKAYEQRIKQEEDYKNLVGELRTEEEQLADQMRERLAILDAMGDLTNDQRNNTLGRIVDDAFGEAPELGKSKDQEGIDEARSELEDWYAEQLDMLETFRKERADLNAQWDEKEAELRKQYQERIIELDVENEELARKRQQKETMIQLSAAENLFGSLADLAEGYAGKQSGIYKTMFAIQKAAAIAQSIVAIQTGIAMASANPFPANLGAMASVAAATAGIIGNISAVGMAHDGLDSVPETGTWLLEKGERVTTANTSAKLDSTLDRVINSMGNGRAGGGVNQTINVQGKPDRRTSKQIAQESAKKQRITAKRYGVGV